MTQFHFLFGVGEIYWKLSIATSWEYTIIYLLVVGYANARPLISLNFVLTDDICSKHSTMICFIICFFLEIQRLHWWVWVWLWKINPIPTVKDFQVVALSLFLFYKQRNCDMEKFYKCTDSYLGIDSLRSIPKVFIEYFFYVRPCTWY